LRNSNLIGEGRDTTNPRSRVGRKVKTQTYTENTDEDDEEEIEENEEEEDERTILYAQNLLKMNKYMNLSECCRERIRIGHNLLKDKLQKDPTIKDFREKIYDIFKEVYNHFDDPVKSGSKNIKLEKECQKLKTSVIEKIIHKRPDYIYYFLRILNDNISIFIKYFKDKIFERPINRQVKEKYFELKKFIQKELANVKETNLKKEKEKALYMDFYNFCKEKKGEIVAIIKDLNRIYDVIIKAAPFLDDLFKSVFNEVENEFEAIIQMDNLHKEEFYNIIMADEFIKSLLIEVNRQDFPCFIELRPVVQKIEEEIRNSDKDMTLLKEIIDEVNLKKIKERMEEGKCLNILKDNPLPKPSTNPQPSLFPQGDSRQSNDDIPPEFDSVKSLNQLLIDTAK
jgi:hypothetical protein